MGEADEPKKSAVALASKDETVADTMGGRIHVRWDEATQATAHGQILFFAESLAAAGHFLWRRQPVRCRVRADADGRPGGDGRGQSRNRQQPRSSLAGSVSRGRSRPPRQVVSLDGKAIARMLPRSVDVAGRLCPLMDAARHSDGLPAAVMAPGCAHQRPKHSPRHRGMTRCCAVDFGTPPSSPRMGDSGAGSCPAKFDA